MSKIFRVTLNGQTPKEVKHIYLDDTIDTVKRKIVHEYENSIGYDAIYIFVTQEKSFVPEILYKELTQNGSQPITHQRLRNFLLNFIDSDLLDELEEKNEYTIGDLYKMRLDKKHMVYTSVGQVFKGKKSTIYPFLANPMLIKSPENEDNFLQENAEQMISTLNSSLVMDIGGFNDNTFHVLTADYVLEHMASVGADSNTGIYYPFLEKQGIDTLDKVLAEGEKIVDKNNELLTKNVLESYRSVEMFYDVYKKTPYPVVKSGIVEYDIMMYQNLEIILPLEQVFKLLHSTKTIPFVKFNPGFRRENLLRLYSEEKTIDGTKIPYLSKAMIIKLIKNLGKSKTITLYLDDSIICSLNEKGMIRVNGESETPLSVEEIEEKIRILVNPILESVRKYVKESGFDFDVFKSFAEENVEVVSMNYVSYMSLDESSFDMKPYMSCVSAIFNVSQDVITKKGGIEMRYKRVANYNEMSAIDAFIREVINKGLQRGDIIEKIKDNFGLSSDEAEQKFIAFINEVDVEQGIFENRKLRIKDNPGFPVTINREKFTSNIIASVNDINNVDYLNLIEIYLRSLVSIIQGRDEESKSVCKKKSIQEDIVAPEIIAQVSKPEIVEASELVMGDDDDDEDYDDVYAMMESDSDDDDDDEDMKGGQGTPGKDVAGMSLSNPNYFSKRMEERDPSLFLKKKEGKFNAYSRMCPSNIRRQPVILTEEEKERIDREHPGSYTNSIKYGSDPENPYYYICPRYWCIPENTSLTEDEVKAGVCGGEDAIIPFSAKKIPPGKSIYEFGVDKTNKSAHAYKEFYDDDGNYITHYPGFISGEKHPQGKCMPCCFKSWTATEQVRRRQECSQEASAKKVKLPKKRTHADTQREYIKGEEKFPIEQERWGYLPVELQLFFGEDSKKYQVSALDTSLKDDAITLMRQGVEPHKTQSFLACIADIYSDYSNEQVKSRIDKELKILRRKLRNLKQQNKDAEAEEIKREIYKIKARPTIADMKKHIIDMLTLDNYTNYQNGNLVTEFHDSNGERDISIDSYQDTEIYKKLDTTDIEEVAYMEYLINSFENFIDYLKDDTVIIDYQYLWDIICMPNEKLFPNGINLVVFEIPEDDITGNLEIVCPTNHYSKTNFDDKKLTLMLVKKGNFFEPIYLYNNMDKKINRFLFREQNLKGNPNIKVALTKVREYMNLRCKPLNSLPDVYYFETNKTLDEVLAKLDKNIKSIVSVVLHYNGKAIGVNIELESGESGFVPCYPSSFKSESSTQFVFMDDESYMKGYEESKSFLNKVHKLTSLPISPHCKVTEDGMVVGILTRSNQVVPLKTPEILEDDDLAVCESSSYSIAADKEMVVAKKKDRERIQFTKALDEEHKNYTAFRNQARIEVNLYKNIAAKNRILDLIESADKDSMESYTETIYKIVSEFRKLLGTMIRFDKEDDRDELVFPETNLLTGKNNEARYYMKLADEALRYQRIKLFLFEKNKYLSFNEILYKLTDSEILILESMITQEYFEGLKAFRRNMYVHNNTYDTALPLLTKKYSDKLAIQKCVIKKKDASSGIVKKLFGDSYNVNEYGDFKAANRSVVCGFDLVKRIMADEGKKIETGEIKELLVESYTVMKEQDITKLLHIMSGEGKEQWIQSIRGGKMTLESFIMSENYYLTFIDLWMIASRLKIPVVFLGNSVTKINKKLAFAVEPKKTEYYFIRLFSPKRNTVPRYQLVESPETLIKIPYSSQLLPDVYVELERAVDLKKTPHTTIDNYIKSLKIKPQTK